MSDYYLASPVRGGRDNHETTKSLLGNLQKPKRKVVSMDDTDKIATTKDGRNQNHNNLLYRNLLACGLKQALLSVKTFPFTSQYIPFCFVIRHVWYIHFSEGELEDDTTPYNPPPSSVRHRGSLERREQKNYHQNLYSQKGFGDNETALG